VKESRNSSKKVLTKGLRLRSFFMPLAIQLEFREGGATMPGEKSGLILQDLSSAF